MLPRPARILTRCVFYPMAAGLIFTAVWLITVLPNSIPGMLGALACSWIAAGTALPLLLAASSVSLPACYWKARRYPRWERAVWKLQDRLP